MRGRGVILLAVAMLLTTVAGAQEAGPLPGPDPSWGTSSTGTYNLHAVEFIPASSTVGYETLNWMRYVTPGGGASLMAGVHLPTGALVGNMYAAVCDTSAGTDLNVKLWRCPTELFYACTTMTTLSSVGLDGCDWIFIVGGPFPFTVDNNAYSYFVEYISSTGDGTQRLGNVQFFYRLQVSPAPASATFGDVPPSHPFVRYIEALAASGVTAGCGGGNYCPDAAVSRGQMAVFLAKALGLHWGS
jgi:hypothetical protein